LGRFSATNQSREDIRSAFDGVLNIAMKSVVPVKDGELLEDLAVTFSRNILFPRSQIKLRTG
jgi:hypothetical protein